MDDVNRELYLKDLSEGDRILLRSVTTKWADLAGDDGKITDADFERLSAADGDLGRTAKDLKGNTAIRFMLDNGQRTHGTSEAKPDGEITLADLASLMPQASYTGKSNVDPSVPLTSGDLVTLEEEGPVTMRQLEEWRATESHEPSVRPGERYPRPARAAVAEKILSDEFLRRQLDLVGESGNVEFDYRIGTKGLDGVRRLNGVDPKKT